MPHSKSNKGSCTVPPVPKTITVCCAKGTKEVPNPELDPTLKVRPPKRKPRGFAAMPPKKQRAIASQGGASHSREHMAAIGARGGATKGKRNHVRKAK